MEKKSNQYLVPTFENKESVIETALSDITFYSWRNAAKDKILGYAYWQWPHATREDLEKYFINSVVGFCSDTEKIGKTQNMIKASMKEAALYGFITKTIQVYEGWRRGKERNYSEMIKSLDKLVKDLCTLFHSMSKESQLALAPFMEWIETFNKSSEMAEIRSFIKYFDLPMEIHCYFGHVLYITQYNELLKRYKEFPEYSDERSKMVGSEFELWNPTCTVHDGTAIVELEQLPYIQRYIDPEKNRSFDGVSYKTLMSYFDISFLDMFQKFIPWGHEPLAMTVAINQGAGSLQFIVGEPDKDVVLQSCGGGWHSNPRAKVTPRQAEDKPKGERWDLQRRIITGPKKAEEFDRDFLRKLKELYFDDFFVKHCNVQVDLLGAYLNELRYIAVVGHHFANITNIPIVFPTIIDPARNRTEIIDACNPTLMYQGDLKKDVVVPNDILIDEKHMVHTITGPNQNGKSRYLDTVALNQMFFQAGWPLFATAAIMSPKTCMQVHYVHSGIGISGESRFSHECARMKKVFETIIGQYPLLLVDEPYTGTNPAHAEVLLEEILQACADEEIPIYLTTHFHGIIEFAGKVPNAINLHCVVENEAFTFKIKEGASTLSNALVVAEKAGVRYDSIKTILQKKKVSPPPPSPQVDDADEYEDDLPF